MALVVASTWSDREDSVLAALPGGRWASATDRALTRWDDVAGPGEPVVVAEPRPGPLVWLPAIDALGWGPTRAERDGPDHFVLTALDDVGPSEARRYRLVAGAVDATASAALVALRYQPPKVSAELAPAQVGPTTRLAVVSLDRRGEVRIVEDDGPHITALVWGDGPLLLGRQAEVWEIGDPWSATADERGRRSLPSGAAPCCLATGPAGVTGAGLTDGTVVTWEPGAESVTTGGSGGTSTVDAGPVRHDGEVRALAWAPDARALATGGVDGRVRVWAAGRSPRDELDLGGAVEALAWLDDGRIVAVVADGDRRVVLLTAA
jgi:hypothetical protein